MLGAFHFDGKATSMPIKTINGRSFSQVIIRLKMSFRLKVHAVFYTAGAFSLVVVCFFATKLKGTHHIYRTHRCTKYKHVGEHDWNN